MDKIIYGIDPGSKESAIVGINEDFKIVYKGYHANLELEKLLSRLIKTGNELAIEWLQSYGLAVGQSTFLTARAIGRFEKAWGHDDSIFLYTRPTIISHITGGVRGIKKKQISDALKLRFGGNRKGEPLEGIATHRWDALAVCCYHLDGAPLGYVNWGEVE